MNPFSKIFPCKKCGIDCADDCVQCDKCNVWIHYDCAKLTDDEIEFYNIPENKFFCCKRCEMAPLTCPPHLEKTKKKSNIVLLVITSLLSSL